MTEPHHKPPTIKDVADLANVHHSTASRALRGSSGIHADTVLRVRAAAAELGYHPNPHAQALKNQRTQAVAAVITDPVSMDELSRYSQPFWLALLMRTTQHLAQAGIGVVQVARESSSLLEPLPIQAIFVMSLVDDHIDLPPSLSDVPLIVERSHSLASRAIATVGHDHAQIAREACGYMRDRGATSVAYLPLSDRDHLSVAAATGYRQWCGQQQEVVVIDPFPGHEEQSNAVREALRRGVDGIFATTGELAAVLAAIRSEGKSCPQDVQVVCIGEGVVEQLLTPKLSSVNLQGALCGEGIAELIRGVIAREEVSSLTFAHRLVARESTRPGGAEI